MFFPSYSWISSRGKVNETPHVVDAFSTSDEMDQEYIPAIAILIVASVVAGFMLPEIRPDNIKDRYSELRCDIAKKDFEVFDSCRKDKDCQLNARNLEDEKVAASQLEKFCE